MNNSKYIYDCLYGSISFPPEVYKIINVPELQRLREVRLCNINSLSITGSANTNRYEHSIGTCFLALKCMEEMEKENPFIDIQTKNNFIRAALLHDIANAPFGHSLEYIMAQEGFNPEEGFRSAIEGQNSKDNFKYKTVVHESVFMGMPRTLAKFLNEDEIEEIGKNVRGEGRFGKLLCGIIDLDNIDNVYRMAYHMGIIGKTDAPLQLAKSLKLIGDEIVIEKDAIPLLWDWYHTREKMYKLLLLNPDEFSGKCMLTECIDCVSISDEKYLAWNDTDFEMIQKLSKKSAVSISVKQSVEKIDSRDYTCEINILNILENYLKQKLKSSNIIVEDVDFLKAKFKNIIYEVKANRYQVEIFKNTEKKVKISDIIMRLMCGELYGCIGIYETTKNEHYTKFLDANTRFTFELEAKKFIKERHNLSLDIAFHPIRDKNKTRRSLEIKTLDGDIAIIGESTDCLLIGAFIKNIAFSTFKLETEENLNMDRLELAIFDFLTSLLQDESLKRIKLYEECNSIMQ